MAATSVATALGANNADPESKPGLATAAESEAWLSVMIRVSQERRSMNAQKARLTEKAIRHPGPAKRATSSGCVTRRVSG